MAAARTHPTLSQVWSAHEETRHSMDGIHLLITGLSETEGQDRSSFPAAGRDLIRQAVADVLLDLQQLGEMEREDRELSEALGSNAALAAQWQSLVQERETVGKSLHLLIELLVRLDQPDTAGWSQIASRFDQTRDLLMPYLAAELDLVRRGLEWHKHHEYQAV